MYVVLKKLLMAVMCLLVCSAFACAAAQDASAKRKPLKRSWAEVKEEINQAFRECSDRVLTYSRKEPRVNTYGAVLGCSQRPGTSFQDLIFHRNPKEKGQKQVLVLDALIERDYDGESGQASPFRIVRHVVKDEGVEMISEVEKYFKEKRWPYVIVDRKKPAKRPGEKPEEVSPAF